MSLDINVIKSSFEKAKPIAPQVVSRFYEILWKNYPDSAGLFANVDMDAQKKALIKSLVFIVDNLENSDRLVAYLKQMGKRHVNYGTQKEHYGWVGDSLLRTFAEFFGNDWTAELQRQWTMAYGVIADTMIAGANEQPDNVHSIKAKPTSKTPNNDWTKEIISKIELPASLLQQIRATVKDAIQEAIKEEINRTIEEELSTLNMERTEKQRKQG